MRVRFCWHTRNPVTIRRISERFRINDMTINRESTVSLTAEELDLLRECEKRGYVRIREITDV